jgi:solute:Na+ symporter, SSS family
MSLKQQLVIWRIVFPTLLVIPGVSAAVVSTVNSLIYVVICPPGLCSGVWSGLVAVTLFIVVSLVTKAPDQKAEEFTGYLQMNWGGKNSLTVREQPDGFN